MSYTILALDLATTTGWALHQQGMERPFFDAVRLPGGPKDVGPPVDALRKLIVDKHKLYGITDLVFEAQHIPTPKKGSTHSTLSLETVYRLIALGGMAEWCAYKLGIKRCFKVHIPSWRLHFLGRGTGFKRGPNGNYLPGEDPKELAVRQCEKFRWHTQVADAAEACGILDYYIHLVAKEDPNCLIPWRDRPLFGGLMEAPR